MFQNRRQIYSVPSKHVHVRDDDPSVPVEIVPNEAILVIGDSQKDPLLRQGTEAIATLAVVLCSRIGHHRVTEAVKWVVRATEGDGDGLQVGDSL